MATLEVHDLKLQWSEGLLWSRITGRGLLGRRPRQLLLEAHVPAAVPRRYAGCAAAVLGCFIVDGVVRRELVLGWAARRLFSSVAVIV